MRGVLSWIFDESSSNGSYCPSPPCWEFLAIRTSTMPYFSSDLAPMRQTTPRPSTRSGARGDNKGMKSSMNIRIVVMVSVLCSAFHLPTYADNWGHWRGPQGNGSGVGNPPLNWGNGKNIQWQVAVPGKGSGSPIVWGDRVFVVTSVPSQKTAGSFLFQLLCFDRQNGKKLWEQTAVEAVPHQETHSTNTHASASPCTDGEQCSPTLVHAGYSAIRWMENSCGSDFGDMQTRNSFGEGSSPTLSGNTLLVPWDHEGPSALFALDKSTGKTLWQAPRDEPTCWATPMVVEHDGRKQVVMNGQNFARAYDLLTGQELWKCGGQTERPCASAVPATTSCTLAVAFAAHSHRAIELRRPRRHRKNQPSYLWTIDHDTPDMASRLPLSGNHLYFYKGKTGQLSCVDAGTGKPHYTAARIPGMNNTYASPLVVNGRVLPYRSQRNDCGDAEDGEQLKVLASNSMGETVDATPAMAGVNNCYSWRKTLVLH